MIIHLFYFLHICTIGSFSLIDVIVHYFIYVHKLMNTVKLLNKTELYKD